MVGAGGGGRWSYGEIRDERGRAGRVSGGPPSAGEPASGRGRRVILPELPDPLGVVQVCRPDRRCGPLGQVSANAKG